MIAKRKNIYSKTHRLLLEITTLNLNCGYKAKKNIIKSHSLLSGIATAENLNGC
jgi:hypothetical protein